MLNYILDLGIIAVITASCMIAKNKGFLKSSNTILSLVVSAVLIVTLLDPFTEYLIKSPIGERIGEKISYKVEDTAEDEELTVEDKDSAEEFGKVMGLPVFMTSIVGDKIEEQTKKMEEIKNDALTAVSDAVLEVVLKILAIILLFLLVKIGVFLLLKLLDAVFKLPLLSGINSALGIFIGLINGILAVYVICAVMALFVPSASMEAVTQAIDNTIIFKYFYNNNLLIELFV